MRVLWQFPIERFHPERVSSVDLRCSPSPVSCLSDVCLAMARCKNVSGPTAGTGGTSGGDGGGDPSRRFSAAEKGKGKKLATKKRKASDREAEVAEAVAAAAEAAERGGRSGSLRIGVMILCHVSDVQFLRQRHSMDPLQAP